MQQLVTLATRIALIAALQRLINRARARLGKGDTPSDPPSSESV